MEDIFQVDDAAFLPLRPAACRLGVPVSWLRTEAEAGRVPHLLVGKRLLFSVSRCERALIEQAESQQQHSLEPSASPSA